MRRPIRWSALRADEAQRVIRERARVTGNVIIGEHAFERIEERSVTVPDVLDILRTGQVDRAPRKNEYEDWEVIVTKRMPGTREAGVVTIVFRDGELLFVKTVQWMDAGR